jgi:hypothetical protein
VPRDVARRRLRVGLASGRLGGRVTWGIVCNDDALPDAFSLLLRCAAGRMLLHGLTGVADRELGEAFLALKHAEPFPANNCIISMG